MDKEQLERRLHFAGEKVPSMKRRSEEHDYSSQCFYMVTMAVEGRRPLFGQLAGNAEAEAGSAEAPHIVLTPLGQEVARIWNGLSSFYPGWAVIALQMMPDHLHGILYFREQREGGHLGHVIRGFKTATNRAYKELLGAAPSSFAATQSQHTGKVGAGQSQHTGKAGAGQLQHTGKADAGGKNGHSPRNSEPGLLWEKGYNDRILHNYHTLERWKAYLQDNPRRLLMKRQHADFLCVQRDLEYKGMTFSTIGNRSLLEKPLKVQVMCSRKMDAHDIEVVKAHMLALGKQGAVFVSPCISKGERAVMRAVFEEGYPVIYLQENGFTDLAKPGGKRFDACARGVMLILAPWAHHNEQVPIKREQCQKLNEMAWKICQNDKERIGRLQGALSKGRLRGAG